MKIGVVILARMSSSRLPGKALMKIKGKEVLLHIVDAVSQAIPVNQIIVATSTEKSDDRLAFFLKQNNINCYRGSLDNVSRRFYEAAKSRKLDCVIRVNGDNIFLEVNSLKETSRLLSKGYSFVSNVKNRTFPKGMSIEGVKLDYYDSLLSKIEKSEYHREHVMSLLYEINSEKHFFLQNTSCPAASGIQLALDTPKDLDRTIQMMNSMDEENWNYNLKEIYSIYKNLGHE